MDQKLECLSKNPVEASYVTLQKYGNTAELLLMLEKENIL